MIALLLTGCAASHQTPRASTDMNGIAESYVKLVLAVGQHDTDYVDAYYGSPEWRKDAEARKRPLAEIRSEAESLISALQSSPQGGDELSRLRHQYLLRLESRPRSEVVAVEERPNRRRPSRNRALNDGHDHA